MQKIQTLFLRDAAHQITTTIDPDCQWVPEGKGRATVKWDGTACLMRRGQLYRRHRVKEGRARPPGWFPATVDGHGWVPIGDGPADQYHREALVEMHPRSFASQKREGTYELVGPHVQGNPYDLPGHRLWPHGYSSAGDAPTDFDALRSYLRDHRMEGIVWHHPDGRMSKIKRRDFGLPWPVTLDDSD